MATRITDEECDKQPSDSFEAHSLLGTVDAVHAMRDDLKGGEHSITTATFAE